LAEPRVAQILSVINGGDAAILYCFLFLYLAFAGGGAWSWTG
jgi:putative oxidoreductase